MEHELFGKTFVEFIPVDPIQHCVYLLILDTQIVYAGKTSGIARRVLQHTQDGKQFDCVLYHNVESENASSELENLIIKWLEPILNIHSTSRHGVKGKETRKRMATVTQSLLNRNTKRRQRSSIFL